MRITIPKLMKEFQLERSEANTILQVLAETDYWQLESYPAGKQRIDECYNNPAKYDVKLHIIQSIIGGFGIEAIRKENTSQDDNAWIIDYINMGDSYKSTICYNHSKRNYTINAIAYFCE